MKCILQIFILLTIVGCSPRVLVNNVKSSASINTASFNEPFAFVFDKSINVDTSNYLGKIEILEGGLTLKCDLPTIKSIAKEKAIELGGNLIYVYEHRTPDIKSTCHRIRGFIYRIENPRDYESEIVWSKNRKLEIQDFKGSTEKRPFLASTYSGFTYYIIPKPLTKKYIVKSETVFDCFLSYFKHSENDQSTLEHEQIHFDMSELYRRKLIKEFIELRLKPKEIMASHEPIFDKYWKELTLKHDEYDSEVYRDRTRQIAWNKWIAKELRKYEQFSTTEIEIKGK